MAPADRAHSIDRQQDVGSRSLDERRACAEEAEPLHAVFVVPCYNEAARLDPAAFAALTADGRVSVLAVDDGSSDETGAILAHIASAHPGRVGMLSLAKNGGKAEAVRAGMAHALAAGAAVVGYADADFATPPHELARLLDELERTGAEVVLGSRVQRLGADIVRNELRHVAGRVFATVSSWTVGVPVYDTQCGAKLFRATPALLAALNDPFSSRWSFDVELLARLFGRLPSAATMDPKNAIEVPLEQWHDIRGSKLHLPGMARAFADLLSMWVRAERFSARKRD